MYILPHFVHIYYGISLENLFINQCMLSLVGDHFLHNSHDLNV